MKNIIPKVEAVPDLRPVNVLGVNVHPLTCAELMAILRLIIETGQRAIVAHANVHGLNLAYTSPRFRQFLNESGIVFCDGFGVKWGAKLLGHKIPERITYANWTWQLAEFAAQHGYSMYFLGAEPGVADKAATKLLELNRSLRIAGTHDGYFDKTVGSAANEAIITAINSAQPDILIVGFGMPQQEYWLQDNWPRLNVHIALPGGAVFDYVSGELRRGPRWMTEYGFEWLARFIIEPRRLWRRYLVGNPLFVLRLIRQRFGLLRLQD